SPSCGRSVFSTANTSVRSASAGAAVVISAGICCTAGLVQPASARSRGIGLRFIMARSKLIVDPFGHVVLACVEHASHQVGTRLCESLRSGLGDFPARFFGPYHEDHAVDQRADGQRIAAGIYGFAVDHHEPVAITKLRKELAQLLR